MAPRNKTHWTGNQQVAWTIEYPPPVATQDFLTCEGYKTVRQQTGGAYTDDSGDIYIVRDLPISCRIHGPESSTPSTENKRIWTPGRPVTRAARYDPLASIWRPSGIVLMHLFIGAGTICLLPSPVCDKILCQAELYLSRRNLRPIHIKEFCRAGGVH